MAQVSPATQRDPSPTDRPARERIGETAAGVPTVKRYRLVLPGEE